MRIPMHLGGTHTDKAINFARTEMFADYNGARVNSAKLAFIITDGKSYDPSLTTIEAEMVRKSNPHMRNIKRVEWWYYNSR